MLTTSTPPPATNNVLDICLKPEFEQVFEHEFYLAQRNAVDLSLISLKVTFDNVQVADDYADHFDNYINSLLLVVSKRLRNTDVVCRCSSLQIVILCRRTAKTQALVIAQQIQQSLNELNVSLAYRPFGLSVNCLSAINSEVEQPADLLRLLHELQTH